MSDHWGLAQQLADSASSTAQVYALLALVESLEGLRDDLRDMTVDNCLQVEVRR